MLTPDVVIIGAGPAGLSAAIALKRARLTHVRVIEREMIAGGIPRHCGHTGYGWREYRRLMSGPDYAARLLSDSVKAGVEISTGTTVTAIGSDLTLQLAGSSGPSVMKPARVLIATGNRELPRSARLIGGDRPPLGVMSTGELQQRIYLMKECPFRNPVIVGSELVAFSALLTLRHAGVRPQAMITPSGPLPVPPGTALAARLLFGLQFLSGNIRSIQGRTAVTGVVVATPNGEQHIPCDGVIVSGHFTPETQILNGRIALEAMMQAPQTDVHFRTSQPGLFAAGNILHPVETAGWCWEDGRKAAAAVLADMAGTLSPRGDSRLVTAEAPIKHVWPQHVPASGGDVFIRLSRRVSGRLVINGRLEQSRRISGRAEQRLRVTLKPDKRPCHISIQETE